MNQKGFAPILIILGIVILVAVAGGAYYLGTSKNSALKPVSTVVNQNNKTVDNTLNNPQQLPAEVNQALPSPTPTIISGISLRLGQLSFQIPSGWWSEKDSMSGGSNMMVETYKLNPTKPEVIEIVQGEGLDQAFDVVYATNFTVDQAVQDNSFDLRGNPIKNETVKINGINAIKLNGILPEPGKGTHNVVYYFIGKGKDVYIIRDYSNLPDHENILNNVISTLKFSN